MFSCNCHRCELLKTSGQGNNRQEVLRSQLCPKEEMNLQIRWSNILLKYKPTGEMAVGGLGLDILSVKEENGSIHTTFL